MHKQPLSFFSAQKINSLNTYERFFHTKRYIQSCNPVKKTDFKLNTQDINIITDMMRVLGLSNCKKFIAMKMEWDSLRQPIPLSCLDYIGVDRNVLDFTLELDYEEYERALEIQRYPQFAIVRLMAAIYKSIQIPPGFFENDAIEYLFNFMKGKRFRCCINYPQLLSIFLEPDEKANYIHYPPIIRFSEKMAIPEPDGTGIGMSYIG